MRMLTLTSKFGALVAAAALALGLAGAAPAATVSFGALPASALANPLATATSGTVIENDPTDIATVRVGPWGGTGVYSSVSKGFASYDFGGVFNRLSFVWGTPDTYNSLQFFLGGILVDSVAGFGNGKNIALPTVTITDIGTTGFDSVRFVSTRTAFEYSNLSLAAIPVPASVLLLLTAIGGMAAVRRRKAA
jgi:hypothetical protein